MNGLRGRRGRTAAWCAAATLALLAAACGGSDSGGGGGGDGGEVTKPQSVKVAVLPVADVAPIYLGIKKGFFKAEKLTLKPQIMQGGAEVTAAVVSGSINVGFSSVEPLMIAKSKNLPVKIMTQGVQAAPSTAQAWDSLLVSSNSSIKSAKDLEGKTIGVNAVKNMNELCVRAVLSRSGVDVSKVKFIEVPFPEMPATLKAGRVDAISAVEPFVSASRAQGAKDLLSYFAGLQTKMTVATYFSSDKWINGNGATAKAFARAMNRSLDYAQAHPDEVRATVPTYTKIPPAVAKKMKLPYWSTDPNRPSIQLVGRQSVKFGAIKSEPDLGQLIWSGAGGSS
jgi:NitT/TauT family transport system substrate-binding protein